MSFAKLKFVGVGLLFALLAAGIVVLKKQNAGLRERLAGLSSQNRQVNALREENERLRDLATRVRKDETDAARVVSIELQQAKGELASLEKRAKDLREQHLVRVATEANNRDPERGMTRLEFFQNVGRSTPAAALQTLVWAALKGDDAALASSLSVTGTAREKAEALLARLPENQRMKFHSPESLAALAIVGDILKTEALEVKGVTMTDATHATLALRRPDSAKEAKIPMLLGAEGWRVVVPERAVDGLVRRLGEAGAEPEKK
jgi:uncharacterized protein HemX